MSAAYARTIITFYMLLLPLSVFSQQSDCSVSGFITDAKSGGELPGATVLLLHDTLGSAPLAGTAANSSGFYKLARLAPGERFIVFRMVGYETIFKQISISQTKQKLIVNARLFPRGYTMEEIVVQGKKLEKNTISTVDISPRVLAMLPTMSGQADVFKVLELLPGVNKASDLSRGLYVRGGSPDQTLTLVDNVMYYNPAHLGNIASTFNADVIRDIKLIKGSYPAEYGGRLSSVLDVKLRSGTREKESGTIGLGLINSYMLFEGPLTKNSSYIAAGRWMYYDKIQNAYSKNGSTPRYSFYDFNCKYNNAFSETSSFSLSAGYSSDRAYSPPSDDNEYDIAWQNLALSLNWLMITSESVFLTTTVNVTDYRFTSKIGIGNTGADVVSFFASPAITDYLFRESAEFKWSPAHTFKTGVELGLHSYKLLYSDYYDGRIESDPRAGKELTLSDGAFFAQSESELADGFTVNAGGRVVYFGDKSSFRFEPRFSASWEIAGGIYLKTAAALSHQFIHLITRNDISLPTDLWYPASSGIAPGRSAQYVFGVDSYFDGGMYQASLEGYYRDMDNIYEYKPAVRFEALDPDIEKQCVRGKGEAYGAEFFIGKRQGDFSGWAGYTLAWTKRKFDNLNGGKVFYPKYDRRHDFSIVLTYAATENFSVSASWLYATGERFTMPGGQFGLPRIGFQNIDWVISANEMNANFFPDYHKLDINANYAFRWRSYSVDAYLNLYNVYNRQNPFAQYLVFRDNGAGNVTQKLKRLTLFPFIPSFGLKVRF